MSEGGRGGGEGGRKREKREKEKEEGKKRTVAIKWCLFGCFLACSSDNHLRTQGRGESVQCTHAPITDSAWPETRGTVHNVCVHLVHAGGYSLICGYCIVCAWLELRPCPKGGFEILNLFVTGVKEV